MDQDDTEKKSEKDKEFMEALDYLNVDSDEVEKRRILSVKKDEDVSKKVTDIRKIAYNYRMILEGRTYIEESGGYEQTSPDIAGRNFRALTAGIINAYADESNLLTQKDFEKFAIQFVDAFEKVENMIMRDRSIEERDARPIFKLFKDSLMNIGDIITGSKENMKRIFDKIQDKMREDDLGNIGF